MELNIIINNNNNNNNNIKELYTQKKVKYEPSGQAMFTRQIENKLNYYRGKGCIKKLCKKLKECTIKIINYEEKEIIPLTKEEKKSYKNQEKCYTCKEKFCMDKDDKDYINRKKC